MKNKGFTLIELMIVLAIVGILLAVIIPVFKCGNKTAEECQAIEQQELTYEEVI